MPRGKPEVITGAREPRGPETVTMLDGPETRPQVQGVDLTQEQAHFVSRFREYAVVVATEPDKVDHSGSIVKGKNKAVRFKDFNLITSDPDVIAKIRTGLGRAYGLNSEVWEKYQQDEDLARKALDTAEAAIDGLPPEMQERFFARLAAKFESFQLAPRVQPQAEETEEQ